MKTLLFGLVAAIGAWLPLRAAPPATDYSRVDVSITPFYNSEGPSVDVGRFSAGLASQREDEFLAAIAGMEKDWDRLTFAQLYVAAIRLYDLGYRRESVYWYYTAQYRGRQFGILLDQERMGGLGSPGFELLQAQNAFHELVGPYINGYAFEDPDGLIKVIERVQKEARQIPDLAAIYPGVEFRNKSEWDAANAELADGMGKLVAMIKEKKEEIRRRRVEEGIEGKFSKLTNRERASH